MARPKPSRPPAAKKRNIGKSKIQKEAEKAIDPKVMAAIFAKRK